MLVILPEFADRRKPQINLNKTCFLIQQLFPRTANQQLAFLPIRLELLSAEIVRISGTHLNIF